MVKIAISPEVTQSSVAGHLEQIIKASPCPFTDEALSSMTEMARIKKIYKFGPVAIDAFLELDVAENSATVKKHIDTLLMSSIAIRGAA